MKIWNIYKIQYYLAVRKTKIPKIEGKIDLKCVILNKVTESQGKKITFFSYMIPVYNDTCIFVNKYAHGYRMIL